MSAKLTRPARPPLPLRKPNTTSSPKPRRPRAAFFSLCAAKGWSAAGLISDALLLRTFFYPAPSAPHEAAARMLDSPVFLRVRSGQCRVQSRMTTARAVALCAAGHATPAFRAGTDTTYGSNNFYGDLPAMAAAALRADPVGAATGAALLTALGVPPCCNLVHGDQPLHLVCARTLLCDPFDGLSKIFTGVVLGGGRGGEPAAMLFCCKAAVGNGRGGGPGPLWRLEIPEHVCLVLQGAALDIVDLIVVDPEGRRHVVHMLHGVEVSRDTHAGRLSEQLHCVHTEEWASVRAAREAMAACGASLTEVPSGLSEGGAVWRGASRELRDAALAAYGGVAASAAAPEGCVSATAAAAPPAVLLHPDIAAIIARIASIRRDRRTRRRVDGVVLPVLTALLLAFGEGRLDPSTGLFSQGSSVRRVAARFLGMTLNQASALIYGEHVGSPEARAARDAAVAALRVRAGGHMQKCRVKAPPADGAPPPAALALRAAYEDYCRTPGVLPPADWEGLVRVLDAAVPAPSHHEYNPAEDAGALLGVATALYLAVGEGRLDSRTGLFGPNMGVDDAAARLTNMTRANFLDVVRSMPGRAPERRWTRAPGRAEFDTAARLITSAGRKMRYEVKAQPGSGGGVPAAALALQTLVAQYARLPGVCLLSQWQKLVLPLASLPLPPPPPTGHAAPPPPPPPPPPPLNPLRTHTATVLAVGAHLFRALREGRLDPATGLFSAGRRPKAVLARLLNIIDNRADKVCEKTWARLADRPDFDAALQALKNGTSYREYEVRAPPAGGAPPVEALALTLRGLLRARRRRAADRLAGACAGARRRGAARAASVGCGPHEVGLLRVSDTVLYQIRCMHDL